MSSRSKWGFWRYDAAVRLLTCCFKWSSPSINY